MNKERILFVDLGSDYGGVETYLRRLCSMLSPYSESFALLSLPKLAEQLRAQGVTVVCIPLLGPRWFKGLRLLLAFFVVPYLLLRYRVRTVQVNGFFESLLLGPLAWLDAKRSSPCTFRLRPNFIHGFEIRSAISPGYSLSTRYALHPRWFVFQRPSGILHAPFSPKKKSQSLLTGWRHPLRLEFLPLRRSVQSFCLSAGWKV